MVEDDFPIKDGVKLPTTSNAAASKEGNERRMRSPAASFRWSHSYYSTKNIKFKAAKVEEVSKSWAFGRQNWIPNAPVPIWYRNLKKCNIWAVETKNPLRAGRKGWGIWSVWIDNRYKTINSHSYFQNLNLDPRVESKEDINWTMKPPAASLNNSAVTVPLSAHRQEINLKRLGLRSPPENPRVK